MKNLSMRGVTAFATVCLAGTAFGQTVTNVTQGTNPATIADAIAAANAGDVLELSAGTFQESGLVITQALTIRGQGQGVTIVDGSLASVRIFEVTGAATDVLIEGMTLTNGTANAANGGGAVSSVLNATARLSDIFFLNNSAGSFRGSTINTSNGGAVIVEDCRFKGNSTSASTPAPEIIILGSTGNIIRGCLFEPGSGHTQTIYVQAANGPAEATIVNNTFVGSPSQSYVWVQSVTATAEVIGNVYSTNLNAPQRGVNGAVINSSRNVHPSLGGANITGAAVFVDFVGGDFRLDPSSPGIDAGDHNAWIAAGGGSTDLNGSFRVIDVPTVFNTAAPFYLPIDAGAFESIPTDNPNPDDACPADLTGASDPNDPSYGVPDGDADGDDFFFYLDLFNQGCPQ